MATATIATHKTETLAQRFVALVPGLLLLAAVGYAGKWIEQSIGSYTKAHHITFPNIEYVLWAIVIGLLLSNTVGVPRIFVPGVATYDFWLKAGIVLLGSRFLLGDVLHLGGISLILVAIALTLSLTFMHLLGRTFKLKPKLTSLLAVGSSICGVSAIIAAKPAIDADDEDASYAIAAILALGAISLFTFPLIGHALHLSDKAYGLWTGLAVDNTAEATAAGNLFSDAAGRVAVLAKTTRNALIGFIVLGYAIYWSGRGQAGEVGNKAVFLWKKFPICIGIPADLAARHSRVLCQATIGEPGEPFPLGVSADLCRSRPSHQSQGIREARLEAFRRWSHRRGFHCTAHAGPGLRSRSLPEVVSRMPPVSRECVPERY